MKYVVVGGIALLLLLGLGSTAAFFAIRFLQPQDKTDDGGERAVMPKPPKLFLGYQTLTLTAGDKKYMEVAVERNGYEGPITLEVENLPKKLSYSLPKIQPERSTTQLELIAADDAQDAESTVRIIARLGNATLEDGVKITLLGGLGGGKHRLATGGAPGRIKILTPGDMSVLPGSSKSVEVRVDRQGYDGAITLELRSGDGSIEPATVDIPQGATNAKINLKPTAEAKAAEAEATLVATTSNPDVKDTLPIRIPLLKRPEPRIAAIEPVILTPGEIKTVDIKIDRNGWAGPVSMTFAGLPEGVTNKSNFLPAGEDTFHVELTCAAGAPEGARQTQVICLAGTSTISAMMDISIQKTGPAHVFKGHTKPVLHIAYRGPTTAVSWGADKMLHVWDLEKKTSKVTPLKDLVTTNPWSEHASLTPSGRWCAIAAAAQTSSFVAGNWVHQVQLWDTDGKEAKRRFLGGANLKGPQRGVTWVTMNDTGSWILCGSMDGFMRLYDANGMARDPENGDHAPQGIEYVAFLPSWVSSNAGRAPAARQPPGGFVPAPGINIDPPPGAGWPSPVLAGGKYPPVVYGKQGGDISFWDLEKAKELATLTGHKDRIYDVAFAPDGSLAASVSRDQSVRIWELKTFKEVARLPAGPDSPLSVAFTPDGKRLVCGGNQGTLRVWDINGKKLVRKLDYGSLDAKYAIHCVAVSADGRNAICGAADGSVSLWGLPR